jgi:hypothetical protein
MQAITKLATGELAPTGGNQRTSAPSSIVVGGVAEILILVEKEALPECELAFLKPLDADEKRALQDCEAKLQIWAKSPFETGRTLKPVRDDRLYREQYANFPAFLKKWHCSRSQADRLIGAARVYDLLTPIGVVLEHVSQARDLIPLTDAEIPMAGMRALRIAAGKKLTAKLFRLAAIQIQPLLFQKNNQTKTSGLTKDTIERACACIDNAKEAVNCGQKRDALQALGEAIDCLHALTHPTAPDKKTAESSISINSNTEPGLLAGAINQIGPAKQLSEPMPPEHNGNSPSKIIPITLVKSELRQAKKDVVAHERLVLAEEVPASGGSSNGRVSSFPKPTAICLDSKGADISRWSQIPICAADWVLDHGEPLPNVTFIKQNPAEFPRTARLKKLRNGWHMDVGDGRQRLLRNARFLLNRSGFEHTAISVRLTDGQTITT